MSQALAKSGQVWKFTAHVPAREIFAVMEQMMGTPPYQFEFVDAGTARILEVSRIGFFGQWTKSVRRRAWVTVAAIEGDLGTTVEVTSSRTPLSLTRGHLPGAPSRALQLVQLLTKGRDDPRSVYRNRRIAPGPVTLVASWAGTPYHLFSEPSIDSARGQGIRTATRLVAHGQRGAFVHVALEDGSGGWVERDQIVAAPAEATRSAGERIAHTPS